MSNDKPKEWYFDSRNTRLKEMGIQREVAMSRDAKKKFVQIQVELENTQRFTITGFLDASHGEAEILEEVRTWFIKPVTRIMLAKPRATSPIRWPRR